MGSYQFLNNSNQVRDSSPPCTNNTVDRGLSKSQMCLHKILQIIASYPSQETSKESSLNPRSIEIGEDRGLGIDLNMGLDPSPEIQEDLSESMSSSCSVAEKVFVVVKSLSSSSDGECDAKDVGDRCGTDSTVIQAVGQESERSVEVSDRANIETQTQKTSTIDGIQEQEEYREVKGEGNEKEDGGVKVAWSKHKSIDSLALLVEAAEMVSANTEEDKECSDDPEKPNQENATNEPPSSLKKSVKRGWVADLYGGSSEDMSPVVRSKRGRSQVLPSRYRDSILMEPWKRLPRPPQRQAAATAAVSTTKRRST